METAGLVLSVLVTVAMVFGIVAYLVREADRAEEEEDATMSVPGRDH